jgi:hypothetical protein
MREVGRRSHERSALAADGGARGSRPIDGTPLEVEEWSSAAPFGDEQCVYPALVEAGLLHPFPSYIHVEPVVDPSIPSDETEAEWSARAEENGVVLADGLIEVVGRGLQEARDRDLAPLALIELTELALTLPVPDPDAPAALATAVRAATAGVRIDPDTVRGGSPAVSGAQPPPRGPFPFGPRRSRRLARRAARPSERRRH